MAISLKNYWNLLRIPEKYQKIAKDGKKVLKIREPIHASSSKYGKLLKILTKRYKLRRGLGKCLLKIYKNLHDAWLVSNTIGDNRSLYRKLRANVLVRVFFFFFNKSRQVVLNCGTMPRSMDEISMISIMKELTRIVKDCQTCVKFTNILDILKNS